MKLFFFDKERLEYKPVKPISYLKYIGLMFLFFILGWGLSDKKEEIINRIIHHHPPDTNVYIIQSKQFSEEVFINLLKDCNIKYPHIVLAQAKVESGNFTSKVFRQNNNMFGMRKARQRITTAESEKNTYAYYRDWIDAVYDYAMYQSVVMRSVENEDQYFTKLGERYAEDSLYVPKLRNIIKKQKLKNIFEE
jgi:hypothetical protein